MTSINEMLFVMLLLLLAACSQKPAEIHYGSDECRHCKMMITDNRFVAQIVTDKGKAIKFDAIECMAVYHQDYRKTLKGARLWVSNYKKPGEWLSAATAQFVKSEVIKSPMGESLLALPSEEAAAAHLRERTGTLLGWEKVSQVKTNM